MDKKLTLLLACSVVGFCYASETQMLVGISSEMNKRNYQEDRFFHGDVDGGTWYGVYDGHGGDVISEFLANNLHNYFSKLSHCCMRHKMLLAFEAAENDAVIKLHPECGSTASVVYIKNNIAYFAHVGDSRAVLECKGKVVLATSDQKPNRPDEKKRIVNAGGKISMNGVWRVNGLAVSRSIGDKALKDGAEGQIIAVPEITEIPLTADNHFLIIASDGLWDVIENEDAVDMVTKELAKNSSLDDIAQTLKNDAIAKGSGDNITVCVVTLNVNSKKESTSVRKKFLNWFQWVTDRRSWHLL
ncbi:MAG TPA: PP2C family protein-serine/threonine phosphatase [Candidatus Babeliales bacterium]|jgi:protein phosphatase 1L|nr:PP2C family protein-serine/threonine phosphatase [Candidatus Babeliales bacterium]